MLTLAVISQKGGAGKTTLALNLAVASHLAGETALVVDLDPQASAATWHDGRDRDGPLVVPAQAPRLQEVLTTASAHGADVAVIDTAPHSEAAALAAARAADLVLIPCRPGIFDLRAIAASADVAALARTSAVAVLNAVPARGPLADEAAQAIGSDGSGMIVAPPRIGHRVAFVHAATAGLTPLETEADGKAAAEIRDLYDWVRRHAAAVASVEVAA